MQIEYRRIAELRPARHNSRTHSAAQVEQIAASIQEFGFTNPILIDEDDEIIAGHGRVMAAQRIGTDPVPCVVLADLTETQKRAYLIADNQLPLNAGWDITLLKQELTALQELDFDIDALGFDTSFLDAILEREVAPPPPQEPMTFKEEYKILISCDGERHQRALLDRFLAENLECKALNS